MKTKLSIILIILFTLNWMYLSESKSRWGGNNPLIEFAINPNVIGFKSFRNQTGFVTQIIEASGDWFNKASSRLIFKFRGISSGTPTSYEEIICDGSQRIDIPQGEVLFYPNNEVDTDCSASSCVYIWSCNGNILHADVELNNTDFSWSYLGNDGDVKNLKTEALKAFGYLAGLGHCQTGEGVSDCNLKEGTDPTPSSVMHKFPQLGKKETISTDDINGIQSIYGTLNLPFPKEGKYALTYKDLDAIQEIIQLINQTGLGTDAAKQSSAKFFQSLTDYNYRKTNKTLREHYDEFIDLVRNQSPEFSKIELDAQRRFLTQGIFQAVMMKEDVQRGYLQLDIGFLDYTIQKHLELRNYTIDLLNGK